MVLYCVYFVSRCLIYCFSSGFQKRVLRLLMEIRDNLKQVGKRCESNESDFHLSQASTLEEIKTMEESLADDEMRKLLVRTHCNTHFATD